jgi:hypothetical protein
MPRRHDRLPRRHDRLAAYISTSLHVPEYASPQRDTPTASGVVSTGTAG